jgi:hypothetical protein
LGGNAAFSTTASGIASRVVVTAAAAVASLAVRHDGHPLSTRGPQVLPTAVSWTTQVQSSTVVVARTIHGFNRDRAAAAAAGDGSLSLCAALIPIVAALHTIERGPPPRERERDQIKEPPSRSISTGVRQKSTESTGDRLASTQCITSTRR